MIRDIMGRVCSVASAQPMSPRTLTGAQKVHGNSVRSRARKDTASAKPNLDLQSPYRVLRAERVH